MQDQSLTRGTALFRDVTGAVGEQLLDEIGAISPDLARFVRGFAFGEVMARPGLDIRERERLNVAVLTALGYSLPQLRLHIHGALNVGVTEAEVVEIILQIALYAGFPAALNGMATAKDVFAERRAKL